MELQQKNLTAVFLDEYLGWTVSEEATHLLIAWLRY